MSDYIFPEPNLRRSAVQTSRAAAGGDQTINAAIAGSATIRHRRHSATGKKKDSPGGRRNPFRADDRLRHVVAIVLLLLAALLLLALVSYTPRDQANADVSLRELARVFSHDPAISARASTTENWLGLIGAFVATMLINATFGFGSIVLPGLIALWGVAIFRDDGYVQAKKFTFYTLIFMTLFAAMAGTLQLISWMLHPAHEWSGSVGAFIAAILSHLIGSAGAFLVLVSAVVIALIYAVNLNLTIAGKFLGGHIRHWWDRLVFHIDAGLAWFNARRTQRQLRRAEAAKLVRTTDAAAAAAADDEPGQMLRNIKGRTSDEFAITGVTSLSDTLVPDPPLFPTAADPMPDSPANEVPANEPLITKHRDQQQPVAAPAQQTAPRLTLDVTEGETASDMEVKDAGELIDKVPDERIGYTPPSVDLLEPQIEQSDVDDDELKQNARLLQEKLATFNIQIENLTVTPGPVVTLYEFVPAAGIKISRIEALADDIALAIKARGIRIIAPIPGKGTVGIEIPNHHPAMVRIRSVLNTVKFREANFKLPLALGKTTVGEVYCDDLSKMPHLLIAGATGAGKSVGVNAIITSLLYRIHPSELKFVIIDPKKIELTQYRSLINHFLACSPDIDEQIITTPSNAVLVLKSLEMEMERRYDILAKVGQRNIADYNQKLAEGKFRDMTDYLHTKMPYIVVVIDELADLMITAAREVEEPIARLAQLARAVGLHLIVATQRPSVDVITGMIKANFPARIAYQVASKVDSRTILDTNGAEQLLGQGDMLYLPAGQPKPIRLQNAFISTEEVEAICEHIGRQQGYTTPFMLPSLHDKNRRSGSQSGGDRDELFDEAARLVVRHQQGSVSMLQRRMKVGYSRAARIMDELEMAGIVGSFDGAKSRAVLLESEAELEAFL